MDPIAAKALEQVLGLFEEFRLGKRQVIGRDAISGIVSDTEWKRWSSDILSRDEKKRRKWRYRTITAYDTGGCWERVVYMNGVVVSPTSKGLHVPHAVMVRAMEIYEESTGVRLNLVYKSPLTAAALSSASNQVLIKNAVVDLFEMRRGRHPQNRMGGGGRIVVG